MHCLSTFMCFGIWHWSHQNILIVRFWGGVIVLGVFCLLRECRGSNQRIRIMALTNGNSLCE